jgi:hypothetical protein
MKLHLILCIKSGLLWVKGMIEYDEAYVEKASAKKIQNQLNRGKGSQRQVIVAVAAESTPLEDIVTGEKSQHCGFFKMKVLSNETAESIEQFVKDSIDKKSVLTTDKNQASENLERLLDNHIKVKSSKTVAMGS